MESNQEAPQKLFEIDLGSLVQEEWTKFLKKIEPLGSGNFGSVYLAEDP